MNVEWFCKWKCMHGFRLPLVSEVESICFLFIHIRVMYENQQLKRRVVYLTNQMNQVNNLISNGSDVSQ